ncbi:MAG: RAMP superfamily CRISPR-associated protein [Candidatus Marinimicrobia bacterium]|nr:RAMP superfamily CRISPR-associated protein [Candidatus Neomarinimicrobiota bacterium]
MNVKNMGAEITGRILVSGTLVNTAPLRIGAGTDDKTDSDLVLDGSGKPYIPGTSWTGAAKDHFRQNFKDMDEKLLEIIFGSEGDDSSKTAYQSAFISYDLPLMHAAKMEIRTSTRINQKTGATEDKSLHDFELLAANNMFDFGFELVIREAYKDQTNALVKFVKTLINELQNGHISVGAQSVIGFGKVELSPVKWKHLEFPGDAAWWFTGSRKPDESLTVEKGDCFEAKNGLATIQGRFFLQDSILVKQDYTGEDENIDSEQMQSNGKNIIPGSSIRGVFRHRARKILNTCDIKDRVTLENNLFGIVETSKRAQDGKEEQKDIALKGKLRVSESIIQGGHLEKQTRIRVDQFTGGVMDGALFSELPLWSDGKTYIDLKLRINQADPVELALILQVIKDLWTGELALGGGGSIGRGKFYGEELTLNYQSKKVRILQEKSGLQIKDESSLIDEIDKQWQTILPKEGVA